MDAIVVLHKHLCKLQLYLQTSVILRICLWCKVTNPLFGHWRECCKLNVLPQVQWLGIRFGLRPYLINSRFQKLCLFRIYPSSLMGRVVSQEDVPVSRFRSFYFLYSELISYLMISRIFFCRLFFIDFMFIFVLFNSASGSCLLN